VASIALMCEPRDIGRTLGDAEELEADDSADAGLAVPEAGSLFRPTLFLYDALPGGVGLARRIYERTEELMERAARLIAHCPCKSGCPACIGASMAHSERKRAARALLMG
jgi:DEAD/DEAH box helicase domain-containing protein